MFLFHSNRVETLVDELAQRVGAPLSDPFAAETVVVQSQGMARWLSQELSSRLGVWANPDFPFPSAFVERVLALASPDTPSPDPWTRDGLRWALSSLLPDLVDDPRYAELGRYLRGPDPLKPLQLCWRLADLYDRYQVWRPELVHGWQQGAEPDDWQASLWRELVRRLEVPPLPERVARLERWCAAGPTHVDLPERVHVFGLTATPPLYLRVFELAAQLTQVTVLQLSPSAEFLGDLATPRAVRRQELRTGLDADELHLEVGHPLLATLGSLGRAAQQTLLELDAVTGEDQRWDAPEPDTALHGLQHALLEVSVPALPPLDGTDNSIEVHCCHSRLREVEVVRERLLAAFAQDPTLRPDQVVVMAPDIEAYAPMVEGVFGVDPSRPDHIPFRVSDRSWRSQAGPAASFLQLLQLLDGRLSAPDVLDWLSGPEVLHRFELGSSDVPVLRELIASAGIAWGLDAAHRQEEGLPGHDGANTWRFGLDRLLAGVALSPDELWQGVLPIAGVEGEAAVCVGRLARAIEVLESLRASSRGLHSPAGWQRWLLEALERTLAPVDGDDTGLQRLREQLIGWAEAAGNAQAIEPMALEAVRWLLEQQIEGRRSHHVFLTGGVTVCAMQPLRAVPFRVVCLLGLAEGQFPRSDFALSFDRIANAPQLGDRSLRDEDCWLFLEALMSCRERLLCTWIGASARDDSPQPASICLETLLVSLEQAHGPGTRDALVVKHPLSLASAHYFGEDKRLALSSRAWAAAARARAQPPEPWPLLVSTRADVPHEPVLELDTVVSRALNPARALGTHLGMRLPGQRLRLPRREPLEPDALERFQLSRSALQLLVQGRPLEALKPLLLADGHLPAGPPGDVLFEQLIPRVRQVQEHIRTLARGEPLPALPIDLTGIGDPAVRLVGWVEDRWPQGALYAGIHEVAGRHRLATWIRHLAQCAQLGADASPSWLIGKEWRTPLVRVWKLRPVEQQEARELLGKLVWLAHDSIRGVLPFFPDAAFRYAETRARRGIDQTNRFDRKANDKARSAFMATGFWGPAGESQNPWVALLDEPERRTGQSERDDAPLDLFHRAWAPPGQPARPFFYLSWGIYQPLLAHQSEWEAPR